MLSEGLSPQAEAPIAEIAADGRRAVSAVYAVRVDALAEPALFEAAARRLTAQRAEMLRRLQAPAARRRCAGAGALLSYVLEQHGYDPGAELSFSAAGKPYLPGASGFHFNLSHAGAWVICAVSSCEVGCDIEEIRPRMPKRILRHLPPEEQRLLAAAPDAADLFFRLWTLRESYAKATGTGLTLPLTPVDLSLCEGSGKPSPASPYRFYEYEDFAGYHCAVCIKGGGAVRPAVHITDFESVVFPRG